jgi:hemerythrin superfamily protein
LNKKELQMASGPEAGAGGGLPTDDPIVELEADHLLVRELFDTYLNVENPDVRMDLGPRILVLLEVHTALEEEVFYPRVRDVDTSLVDQCVAEHEQARQLMEQLHGMDGGDPQTARTFRQLADLILKHIDTEEQQLFPKVRQANVDLAAIGDEMHAFEVSIVAAAQAQASQQPGMRQ